MACRGAPSCVAQLAEATAISPNRNKASDGMCASQGHSQQNPTSDHEPGPRSLAHAVDLTHDSAHGIDAHKMIREGPVKRRDSRGKYFITDGKIIASYPVGGYPAWAERPYHGANPHKKHTHSSIKSTIEAENDTRPWFGQEEADMPLNNDDLKQIEKIVKDVVKPIKDDVDRLRDVVGHDTYIPGQTLIKSLIRLEDPQGDGTKEYYEHLDLISLKLDEYLATIAELADAYKKLAGEEN